MTKQFAQRASVLAAFLISMTLGVAASAATIVVNSVLDDVFVNASGAIFSDASYTTSVSLASSKCTLRMALAAANTDTAIGGANGCVAGSGTGTDTITIGVNGTIKLSQVAMELAPLATTSPATWILYTVGNVTITGPGSSLLTINGGGSPAALRACDSW